jgi:RepB DNA-primase from phage plasmid
VESGGGVHAYWLFRQGEPVTEGTRPRIELALRRLANHVGGDASCAEVSRILRVPGSTNYKREQSTIVRVVRKRPAR